MKRILLNQLKAVNNTIGYYDDVISSGSIVGNTLLLEDSVYMELKKKYNTNTNSNNIGCSTCQPPSLITQMKSVTKAAGAVFKGVIKGIDTRVNAETLSTRVEICNACEFKSGNRCNKCGCNLSLKQSLSVSVCPINKWQAV